MITNEMNRRLFSRDTMLRDNCTVTLGTYLRLLAPYPITRNMKGIPLLQSMYPAIVMQTPSNVPSIQLNKYIQANQTGVAILKSIIVDIRRTAPVQTTCSGKHCDKARPLDWCYKPNQGCGCYGTSSLGTSNIALVHHVFLHYNGDIYKEEHFSSTKFNKLFMDRPIPPNTMVTALEQTEAAKQLDIAIDKCLAEVNENGGFEVLLWYSRGEISDVSLLGLNAQEEETHVGSGKINYHIVEIKPMNEAFSDTGCVVTELGRRLQSMKFRVGEQL